MKKPLVSIVTAAHNAAPYIRETIMSVQGQSLRDWEHIVIDDGSTDTTVAEVEAVADARLRLFRQDNAGQSAAQNTGLAQARGGRLLMLDADDRLLPDALFRLCSALDAAPEAVLAYGGAWFIDEKGDSFGHRPCFPSLRAGDYLAEFLTRNLITSGGAAMVCAEAIKQVGWRDPDLKKLVQDWECWCRLAAMGPIVPVGGDAVLEYRLHQSSISRSAALDPEWRRPAMEKVFGNPDIQRRFTPERLRDLRRQCESNAWYMAGMEAMRARRFDLARRSLTGSLRQHVRRPKAWILLACAFLGWMPPAVARRIGTTLGPPPKS